MVLYDPQPVRSAPRQLCVIENTQPDRLHAFFLFEMIHTRIKAKNAMLKELQMKNMLKDLKMANPMFKELKRKKSYAERV